MSIPWTESDRQEDPIIPGYIQLRQIWSLSSAWNSQPAGRPGDQWWTRQRLRRVCHQQKKKYVWNNFTVYTITRKLLERSTPHGCGHSRDSWPAWVCIWVPWFYRSVMMAVFLHFNTPVFNSSPLSSSNQHKQNNAIHNSYICQFNSRSSRYTWASEWVSEWVVS